MNTEEEFGALCAFPWKASENNECDIEGQWAEDGSCYTVTCPPQLRKQLISLQVRVYCALEILRTKEREMAEHKLALDKVFG